MSVWAYVAHKDGYWAGACSGTHLSKKEIAKFTGDFIADGFSITPCSNREEYDRLIESMPDWSQSPEYKAKHGEKQP